MRRHWTLNDAIQHHKHGFVGESQTEMTLSYKRNGPSRAVVIMAETPFNLDKLLEADLIRADKYRGKEGFRLRFVRDTTDNQVYIQRDESSPRHCVAKIPPDIA